MTERTVIGAALDALSTVEQPLLLVFGRGEGLPATFGHRYACGCLAIGVQWVRDDPLVPSYRCVVTGPLACPAHGGSQQ